MDSSLRSNPTAPNVTILMSNGTQFDVLISDIDRWFYFATRVSTNYGTQVGACLVMFLVTLVLAGDSQRRKLVYILNVFSLVLGFVRAMFQLVYFSGHWQEFYNYFTDSQSNLTKSDFATSVAGTVMPLLMTAAVNMSLALQAHTVCKVMERKYYYTSFGFSCVVLLLALGFRFAECVTNSMAITSGVTYFDQAWITIGTLATQAISIGWFSILFMWKLGWTVWTRKKMGWPNLRLVEFLMIMSGCTMIIPCKWLPYLL
jgi:pheromone alpha factor receptor